MNNPVAGANIFPQYYRTISQQNDRVLKPISGTDLVFVQSTAMGVGITAIRHHNPFLASHVTYFNDGCFYHLEEQQICHIVSVECSFGNTVNQTFYGFVRRRKHCPFEANLQEIKQTSYVIGFAEQIETTRLTNKVTCRINK